MKELITQYATDLALLFCDADEIPSRFKQGINKPVNKDSNKEKLFQARLAAWGHTVSHMFERLDVELVKRFIYRMPQVPNEAKRVADCDDFIFFNDYLILRRDTEGCSPDELGNLAMLSIEFQKQIEKQL